MSWTFHQLTCHNPVAQWTERETSNLRGAGPNPAGVALPQGGNFMLMTEPKPIKYILEFMDAGDSRQKSGFADREGEHVLPVVSSTPIPIPSVGEIVSLTEIGILLKVESRRFAYYRETSHTELFCIRCDSNGNLLK